MYGSQTNKNDLILELYQDARTVFKIADISLLTGESNSMVLAKKLNYHVATGKINNPRRGFYTKPGYSIEELAGKLYTPCYLSLQFVLQRAGIIFQCSEEITSISYLSREVAVDGQVYSYRKTKQKILYNWNGIVQSMQGVYMATPERAFLDLCYLEPEDYFDHLNPLDQDLIEKLLPVYSSKALIIRVKRILKS